MEIPKKTEEPIDLKNLKDGGPTKMNIKIHAENLSAYLQDSNKIYKKSKPTEILTLLFYLALKKYQCF